MGKNIGDWCFKNYPEIEAWDDLPDGVSVLDTNLSVVNANRTMKSWYAHIPFSPGEKCYRVYHNRKNPCPWCPTRMTLSRGKAQSGIVPYHGRDGTVQGWQKLLVFPIFDGDGNLVGVMEYVQDVTETRFCQFILQALEQEVEFLRTLVEKTRQIYENWQESLMTMARNTIKPPLQFLQEASNHRSQEEQHLKTMESFFSQVGKEITWRKNRYSFLLAHLTPREFQVALLIAQGKSTKEIAEELSLSLKAVEFHRGQIREKLGIRNTKVNLQSYLLAHFASGAAPGDFQG
ncbi:MAG: LuxR C-terminal-related transcriptional regulator [Atribacterota bacterium]|nr:LuxR C-terminal-related transcriptional regulator [Atribacterota bacterium]